MGPPQSTNGFDPTASDDHRIKTRVLFDEPVEIIAPRPCLGRTVDIADGGIGLVLNEAFEIGERLTLKIFEGRVLIQGEVCWRREEEAGNRHGIRFSSDDLKIVESIHALRIASDSD